MEQAAGLTDALFEKVPIWSLSDDLLSRIFTYLNPSDRFRLAEVCTRWAGVSRIDWTDIISLDLSSIPKKTIGPIIQLCPKVVSITTQDCELNVTSITENLRSELKSLNLYRVSANVGLPPSPEDTPREGLPNAFLRELQQVTHLEELVLSELPVASLRGINQFVWDNLSSSLKRVQLHVAVFCSQSGVAEGVREPFGSTECLVLEEDRLLSVYAHDREAVALAAGMSGVALFLMRQLRELCLGPYFSSGVLACAGGQTDFALALNQLEVISMQLSNATSVEASSGITPLLTSHPTLRILIITGTITADADEILMPPRRRYPNGFGSDPLPLLHVFIGGPIAQKIRFTRSSNDAMVIHPINLPMPAFLEQPEVAAIFKGSWIAEMIKKGAKANSRLWDYDARIAQSVLFLNL